MAATQYNVFCRYFNEVISKSVTNNPDADWMSSKEWRECDPDDVKEQLDNLLQRIDDEKAAIDTALGTELAVLQAQYNALKPKVNNVWTGVITSDMQDVQQQMDALSEKAEKDKSEIDVAYENEVIDYTSLYNKYLEKRNNYIKNYKDGIASREEIVKIRPVVPVNIEEDVAMYRDVMEESTIDNLKYDFIFMYDGIVVYDPKEVGSAKHGLELIYDNMKRIKQDPWFLFETFNSLTAAMDRAKILVDMFGLQNVRIGKVVALDQYIYIY